MCGNESKIYKKAHTWGGSPLCKDDYFPPLVSPIPCYGLTVPHPQAPFGSYPLPQAPLPQPLFTHVALLVGKSRHRHAKILSNPEQVL
jgi:hypothetical protein